MMNWQRWGLGVKKTFPLMLGVIPFGLAYGITAIQNHLSLAESTLMSGMVFAGAAQFTALSMLGQGAGYSVIVLATLLINLRHLLMGLSLSVYLKQQNARRLSLLAFGMVDECYAATIAHYQREGINQEGDPLFMLGSASGLYFSWMASSILGGLLGGTIKDPLQWGLDFAMPATFLSIMIPQIVSVRMLIVAGVAGCSAVLFYLIIPGKWYILLAALLATFTGAFLESLSKRRSIPSCA